MAFANIVTNHTITITQNLSLSRRQALTSERVFTDDVNLFCQDDDAQFSRTFFQFVICSTSRHIQNVNNYVKYPQAIC